VDSFSKKEVIFYFAHRKLKLINILWKTLLKNAQKVDNSRGAASNQGFKDFFLSIYTLSIRFKI